MRARHARVTHDGNRSDAKSREPNEPSNELFILRQRIWALTISRVVAVGSLIIRVGQLDIASTHKVIDTNGL